MPMPPNPERGLIIFEQTPEQPILTALQQKELKDAAVKYVGLHHLARTPETLDKAAVVLAIDALPRGIALTNAELAQKGQPPFALTPKTILKSFIEKGKANRQEIYQAAEITARQYDRHRDEGAYIGPLAFPRKVYAEGVQNVKDFVLQPDIKAASLLALTAIERKQLLPQTASRIIDSLQHTIPNISMDMFGRQNDSDWKTREQYELNIAKFVRNFITAQAFGIDDPFFSISFVQQIVKEDIEEGFTEDSLEALYTTLQVSSEEEQSFIHDIFYQTRVNLLGAIARNKTQAYQNMPIDQAPIAVQRDRTHIVFRDVLFLNPAALEEPSIDPLIAAHDPRVVTPIAGVNILSPFALEYKQRQAQGRMRFLRARTGRAVYAQNDHDAEILKRGLEAWKHYEERTRSQMESIVTLQTEQEALQQSLAIIDSNIIPDQLTKDAIRRALTTEVGRNLASDITEREEFMKRMEDVEGLVPTFEKAHAFLQQLKAENNGQFPPVAVLPEWLTEAYKKVGEYFRGQVISYQQAIISRAFNELHADLFQSTDHILPDINWRNPSEADVTTALSRIQDRLDTGKTIQVPTSHLETMLTQVQQEILNSRNSSSRNWKDANLQVLADYLTVARNARNNGQSVVKVPLEFYRQSLKKREQLVTRIYSARSQMRTLQAVTDLTNPVTDEELGMLESNLGICISPIPTNASLSSLDNDGYRLTQGAQENIRPLYGFGLKSNDARSKHEFIRLLHVDIDQVQQQILQKPTANLQHKLAILQGQQSMALSPYFPDFSGLMNKDFWASVHFLGLRLQWAETRQTRDRRLYTLRDEFETLKREKITQQVSARLESVKKELAQLRSDPATKRFVERMTSLGLTVA